MKKDAHYYAVLAFCRACGFRTTSAHEIAFASQYVDDAKVNHIKLSCPPPVGVRHRDVAGCPSFFNMATCHHYDRANTYNLEAMLYNTCAFHFPPGAKGASFVQKMQCVKGSESNVLQRIRQEVMNEDRVTLGVFLHAFADSFSHQGFSGLLSKVNRVQGLNRIGVWYNPMSWRPGSAIRSVCRKLGIGALDAQIERFVPAYGHLQAADWPDVPCAVWEYQYDDSDELALEWKEPPELVRNPDRYREAFQGIREILEEYLDKHPEERDPQAPQRNFQELFDILLGNRETRFMRIRRWKKFLKDGLIDKDDEVLKYDKDAWLKGAFNNFDENKKQFDKRKVDCADLVPNFANTPWYRFYLAVDWYKTRLCHHCEELGLHIPGSTVPPVRLAA